MEATATTHPPASSEVPKRRLGRTEEQVSIVGMGGFHIGHPYTPDNDAIKLIHAAIDRGITFMDNSWDYNAGMSELRMGRALSVYGYRERVFLMTKIDGRTKDSFNVQLGKVRFIGFTGHKDPAYHLHMIELADRNGFAFDTVQMPINVFDAHYKSFAAGVIPVAQAHDLGILAMKTFGDANLLETGLVDPIDMLHYGMTLPTSVVITGIDKPEILDQAIAAATSFAPLSEERIAAILAKTAAAARDGKLERYKTSHFFDSTFQNPSWLG